MAPLHIYEELSLDRFCIDIRIQKHPWLWTNPDRYKYPHLYLGGAETLCNPFSETKAMINSPKLSKWLEDNVHQPLIDHFLLMSTEATLMSYSVPKDIIKYRSEAALVSKAWKEYERALNSEHKRSPMYQNLSGRVAKGELQNLTIEAPSGVILIRAIQPCLLLALVGGSPPKDAASPNQSTEPRFTAEAKGSPRYPPLLNYPRTINFDPVGTPATRDASPVPREDSGAEVVEADDMEEAVSGEPVADVQLTTAALHMQRSKLDSMADWLKDELWKANFIVTPDVA